MGEIHIDREKCIGKLEERERWEREVGYGKGERDIKMDI